MTAGGRPSFGRTFAASRKKFPAGENGREAIRMDFFCLAISIAGLCIGIFSLGYAIGKDIQKSQKWPPKSKGTVTFVNQTEGWPSVDGASFYLKYTTAPWVCQTKGEAGAGGMDFCAGGLNFHLNINVKNKIKETCYKWRLGCG